MPDMHRFGDVRRTEVDDDLLRLRGAWYPEMLVARKLRETGRQRLGLEPEIDEPRTGNLRRRTKISHLQLVDDLLRNLPWVRLRLLGEDHGDIRLVITKARVIRRHHLRVGVGKVRRQRGAEAGNEKRGNGFHGKMKRKGWDGA